jgi:hypothetical protein
LIVVNGLGILVASEGITAMALKKKPASITVFSFPPFLYVWPVIVFGFLFAGIQSMELLGDNGLRAVAWTYLAIMSLVLITMGVDLNLRASIFCLVLFFCSWFGILWLQGVKEIKFFGTIGAFIREIDLTIPSSFMATLSFILLFIYLIMLFMAYFNDRYRITHNEIEHHVFGYKEDAIGRGAKRVRAEYTDLLELLICGSGTIRIFSATGNKELLVIQNVPLLVFRKRKISRILETVAIETMQMEEEYEETDEGDN